MPAKPQLPDLTQRQDLTYFEGVNSLVGHNLAQKQELYHAENVRSKDIGILEKREGTAVVGNPLDSTANYLLTDFLNKGTNNSGLYRISTVSELTNLYFMSADPLHSWNPITFGLLELGITSTVYNITKLGNTLTYTYVSGTIPVFSKLHVGTNIIIQGSGFNAANRGTFPITSTATNSFSVTNALGVAEAGVSSVDGFIRADLSVGTWPGTYSSTIAEGYLFLVNGMTQNQSVSSSGNDIGIVHLVNSPRARKINYYKDKLYLGDYFIDATGSAEYFLGVANTAYTITDTSRPAVSLGSYNFGTPANSTQYTITHSGTTFTYSSTEGSHNSANIAGNVQIGDTVVISGVGFLGANQGVFFVVALTSTSFSILNASGVDETVTFGPTTSVTRSAVGKADNSLTYTFSGGTDPAIGSKVHDGDILVINAQHFNAANNGTFVVTSHTSTSFVVNNGAGVPESGVTIGTGSIHHAAQVSSVAGTEYPTGVMMSSVPLGILALADGDAAANAPSIEVTDTKYIDIPSLIYVMRGNKLITTLNVTDKTETSITVSTSHAAIQAADELWVDSSITGNRQFKWNSVPSSGIDVKQYDTFKLTGANQNDRIRMLTNIGNVMVIANTENIGIWDNYKLDMLDGGIGCVADNGYAKIQGQLFFLHYSGIYVTQGGPPQLISGAVSRYIRGATRAGLENGAMGVITKKGISLFCSIGDVNLYREDGSFEKTLTNVALEYNLQQKIWFVHTEVPARLWTSYIETTDPDKLLYASDDSGYNVYEFLTGSTDTVDRTTVANIAMRMDTNRLYMGKQYDRIGQALEIGVEAERGANIRTFVSLDAQPYYELPGQSSKGISILKIVNVDGDSTTPPRARFLRASLRDYSNQTVKVSRLFLTHLEATERENIRFEGSAEA